MDVDWEEARAAFEAGRIGGAELACTYVASRVRRVAGPRWLQGPRKPALDAAGAPPLVRIFAERELHRLPRPVAGALVGWAMGSRPVELLFAIPTPRAVLALQARGRRCVSLLDDAEAPPATAYAGGGDGGLGFAVHDLCHLEKFVDPEHHRGQVGFFAALHEALGDPRWLALEASLDAAWVDERDHVLADMNGSAVFLYVILRNKLKLAIRRRAGRERGAPCGRGALDAGEQRAYADAVEVLLDALGIEGAPREAARALTSRHDAEGAAPILDEHFQSRGAPV